MTISTTISTKGQIVIPATVREKYALTAGSKIEIEEENGTLILIPPTKLAYLCGSWRDLDTDNVLKEIENDRKD